MLAELLLAPLLFVRRCFTAISFWKDARFLERFRPEWKIGMGIKKGKRLSVEEFY